MMIDRDTAIERAKAVLFSRDGADLLRILNVRGSVRVQVPVDPPATPPASTDQPAYSDAPPVVRFTREKTADGWRMTAELD